MKPFLTILTTLCLLSAPAYAQTLKSLMFNTTNGQIVANTGTNVLTITNDTVVFQAGIVANKVKAPEGDVASIESWDNNSQIILDGNQISVYTEIFGIYVPITFSGTNASLNSATTRTNLGLGATWLTNTDVTNFRTAIGLGATNDVTFRSLNATNELTLPPAAPASPTAGDIYRITNTLRFRDSTNGERTLLNAQDNLSNLVNAATARTNLGATTVGNAVFTATNAAAAASAIGLGTTNNVTFSNITANGTLNVSNTATFATNVTVSGSLSVASLAITTPVGWVYDAVQTAAATNGTLTLPDTANVLRVTNTNSISAISNGRLGAVYFLINQSAGNLVISNTATIAVRGAANLTLGTNQAATIIATTATNASVH